MERHKNIYLCLLTKDDREFLDKVTYYEYTGTNW